MMEMQVLPSMLLFNMMAPQGTLRKTAGFILMALEMGMFQLAIFY